MKRYITITLLFVIALVAKANEPHGFESIILERIDSLQRSVLTCARVNFKEEPSKLDWRDEAHTILLKKEFDAEYIVNAFLHAGGNFNRKWSYDNPPVRLSFPKVNVTFVQKSTRKRKSVKMTVGKFFKKYLNERSINATKVEVTELDVYVVHNEIENGNPYQWSTHPVVSERRHYVVRNDNLILKESSSYRASVRTEDSYSIINRNIRDYGGYPILGNVAMTIWVE